MKWYCGADHAGFELKAQLVSLLRELGDEVIDFGTDGPSSVDYPDYGSKVATAVASDDGTLGLLVCGTGIGMSMVANKVPGVRAALVTNEFTARATRSHNNANVLTLGARVTGAGVAEQALRVFRDTPFQGGRHQRRIDKIDALDR